MSVGQVAVRYAKALFQLAREREEMDRVRSDMETLLEMFASVPEITELMESPLIDSTKKAHTLIMILSPQICTLTIQFIQMVAARKREEYLPGMARHYVLLYKEDKSIKVARLKSAVPIGTGNKEQIVAMIRKAFKAEIELEEEVDEELIGGFVLRVEDRQLDASVKGKLNRIKKELQQ